MGQLMINEWIKLSKKKATWVMYGLLVLLTFLISFGISRFSTNASTDAADVFANLTSMTSVLNLFVVVVTASIVAEEFSRGTIKFLLIRPYSRSQILFSKAVTCLLFGVLGTVLLYLSSFVAAILFFGEFKVLFEPMMMMNQWSPFFAAFVTAAVNLLLQLLYISITLFISAGIRSQPLAVGLGVGLLFGSTFLNGLLLVAMQRYEWLKWTLFNMLNIRQTLISSTDVVDFYHLNFWEMLVGLILYSGVIYFFTDLLFKKRDVALN